ncbi:MAG: metallophosphoesterase [Planctomycetaceae bacterium]
MQWLWWIILAVGCAEWVVTLINRVHGLPVRERRLRHVRHLQEALLVIVPWTVFLGLLIHSRELMHSFLPEDRSPNSWFVANFTGLQGWISIIGMSGFIGLMISMWRFHFGRVPKSLLLNHATTVDVEKKLGHKPLGHGPYRWMARFPRNEIFRVQIGEKHFRLPRLPKEWAGLSIVHLTDMHFIGTIRKSYFEQICEIAERMQPNLFVFTGDLLDDQSLAEWLPETLGRLKAPLGCRYILGNHDWNLDVQPIRDKMNRLGWIDVSGRSESIRYRDKEMIIGGTELPWMGEHPDFSGCNSEAFRLLLSHTPDNLAWARREKIDLMLSGHNHGGQVILPFIGPVFSPSLHGVRYAGGVYDVPPTLLYVSRGLSSRYPLRWNCPPELTKLVLHPAR